MPNAGGAEKQFRKDDVPSGTPDDVARAHVERHIAKLRTAAAILQVAPWC